MLRISWIPARPCGAPAASRPRILLLSGCSHQLDIEVIGRRGSAGGAAVLRNDELEVVRPDVKAERGVLDDGAVDNMGAVGEEDLVEGSVLQGAVHKGIHGVVAFIRRELPCRGGENRMQSRRGEGIDRKSTRLNSSHMSISYAVF